MNEHLDTDYHEIMLKPAVAELLPKLVYHMDEPRDRHGDSELSGFAAPRAKRCA